MSHFCGQCGKPELCVTCTELFYDSADSPPSGELFSPEQPVTKINVASGEDAFAEFEQYVFPA